MSQTELAMQKGAQQGGFIETLKKIGPGIVFGLSFLGVGDVIDVTLAGSKFGYGLYWTIFLSWIGVWFWAGMMGKYEMCNIHNESVMDGMRRIGKWLLVYMGLVSFLMGHLFGAFLIGGTVSGITGVFPFLKNVNPILPGLIAIILAYYAVIRGYGFVEMIFKLLVIAIGIAFVGGWFWSAPNPADVLSGFIPRIPKDGAATAVMLLGATGTSFCNILYPYFVREKGWRGMEKVRLMRWDLGIACVVMVILDLAIIGVGANMIFLKGGNPVEEVADIAKLFESFGGTFAYWLFWIGLFTAAFTTFWGIAYGLSDVVQDCTKHLFNDKVRKFGKVEKNIGWHATFAASIILPIVWLFTDVGLVPLSVFVFTVSVIFGPVLAIGTMWIANKTEWIGKEGKATWWENLGLGIVTAFSVYLMIKTLADKIAGS